MTAFRTKKINEHQDIGKILKGAREKSGLSLNLLSDQLKINKQYLGYIENNDWQKLPGEFYIKIFVKKYAEALGVRFAKLNETLEKEMNIYEKWDDMKKFNKKVDKSNLLVLPNIIKRGAIILIVLIIVIYLIFQVSQVTNPPSLEILQPTQDTITIDQKFYTIYGQTDNNAKVKINSQEIIPDNTGFFSLQLDLSPDLNIIRVEAKTRYSRNAVKIKEIISSTNVQE